ncbi:MAG: AAA family ATPase [Candidatus Eremiobacteraeota bacterium]|nr:AAA family ATPase [Candidatus Eremiobacteraeota bacterium]MCW5866409.1 AAA family ATPase [Candidatus Eremiobacteraeota bacterium]
MTPLAAQFVASFRRAIEAEKAALRQDSSAYEVALEGGRPLSEMTQGEFTFYAFQLPRASERVTPGLACSLREPSGLEVPVTVAQLSGGEVVLRSEVRLHIREGAYRLLFVPWFLYDEMHQALENVPFPEMALRAFGKQPVERQPMPTPQFEFRLNPTQREAVQLALESQLAILWGPPGTGKTTTLAQLIALLVGQQRRVLITSTTHAALDQVLARLRDTRALHELFARHQVLQLGSSGHDCCLDEVVQATQSEAYATLGRSRPRLEGLLRQHQELLPLLQKAQVAAAQSHQLDLFVEAPAGLEARELTSLLGPERAARWSALDAQAQCGLLQRLCRRLEALQMGWRLRARVARTALTSGQQQAVDECRILLTTLANSYVSPLLKEQHFDSVVVEEAGMALLPAIYLAAGRARQQVVLVGDPQQLPAILASRDSYAQQAMGRNIFAVLGERPERLMLDVQYRMHPEIGELVSRLFYNGGLRHQPPAEAGEIAADAPYPGDALVVVDLAGQARTDPGDFSRYNPESAHKAVALAREAAARGRSVAVISPYRKQVQRIQQLLQDHPLIDCATVHRFQGHERDVVILDITDGPPLEPGVLLAGRGANSSSANLLNVSLSRARGKLIVIAPVDYVRSRAAGTTLAQVLEWALQHGVRRQ